MLANKYANSISASWVFKNASLPDEWTLKTMNELKFWYCDGGRSAAGFKGKTSDCVTRAITIAAGRDYQTVYDELNYLTSMDIDAHHTHSSRSGITRQVYDPYLTSLGFEWHPTMHFGVGCTVHMRADELPTGMIIVRLSKHLSVVNDHVILDTHDPSRQGTRCVYGYWTQDD